MSTSKKTAIVTASLISIATTAYSADENLISERQNIVNGLIVSYEDKTFTVIDNTINSGGAIYNDGQILLINNSTFQDNSVDLKTTSYGGAIFNNTDREITEIKETAFVTNRAVSGGAINNFGTIKSLDAIFWNNSAYADPTYGSVTKTFAQGGAIYNRGRIEILSGTFLENIAKSDLFYAYGGAIFNGANAYIGTLSADFTRNTSTSFDNDAFGGALITSGTSTIDSIKDSKFTGNSAYSQSGTAQGGAIRANGTIGSISNTDFDGNYTKTDSGSASGGAIHLLASGTINEILNSNFKNNYVDGTASSNGGAIAAYNNLTLSANNGTSLFSGNYVLADGIRKNNAIYMNGTNSKTLLLSLNTHNNGSITFDDDIDGAYYNIYISGDKTGVVNLNGKIENAGQFTMADNSAVHLGINSNISVTDFIAGNASTTAESFPLLTVDVKVDKATQTVQSGKLNVSGDVSGSTKVLINSLNPDVLNSGNKASVAFLSAPNDNPDTLSSFSVYRVKGSPFMWNAVANQGGETTGSTWYLTMDTDTPNPDYPPEPGPEPEPEPTPDNRKVAPEVIAYIGLPNASIEQTRSLASHVFAKVNNNRVCTGNCGFVGNTYQTNRRLNNTWISPVYFASSSKEPVEADAKIGGVEAGFDIQADMYNKIGLFASYRYGQYDLSGKGQRYYSAISSEIDINSYLGGLYYHFEYGKNRFNAMVFGGIQEADLQTDDGIKTDTQGTQYGAAADFGHSYALTKNLALEPSLGVFYTRVDYDDVRDTVGKTANYEAFDYGEAELSLKLEQSFYVNGGIGRIYAKPSVVQTLSNGGDVMISGLKTVSGLKNQTLGRIEIGLRVNINTALAAYGISSYTYGSDYEAADFGLGLSYSW